MSELSHERIRAYLQLGRASLTLNERLAVDEHLRVCAACRTYAADLSELQASLTETLHQRWDAAPVPKFAPGVLSRLQKNRLPQRMFSYALGLGALAALILLLQAFFTTQLQLATQSPLATEPSPVGSTTPLPLMTTALPVTPFNVRPTPTLPSGRDFFQVQRLTNTVTGAFRPAVSPDGRRVAYASERDGNWDIYVLDLNTKVETRLTDDPQPDMAPSWSPDGTRLAYQHNVPSPDGPVLVDYTVMDVDGSNKRVVYSGAHWLKNAAPQWSPSGARLAFSNGTALIALSLDDLSDDLFIQSADEQPYEWPAWFDNQHPLYVGNGQMMFSDLEGNSQAVLVLPDPVQVMVAAPPYIVYLQQQGTSIQVGRTSLDEIPAHTLAVFSANALTHAALSPNGQFVAIQTETEVVVVAAGLPSSWQQAPLFRFSNNVPPSDLLSVSWLPDSSGFVFVSESDGKPELHLAQLNLPAIDYLKSLPSFVGTPAPTPNPTDTSAFGSIVTSFTPDSLIPLDSSGFSFGAAITTTSQIDVIAHVVAFAVRPEEAVADCNVQEVPTDRPFWANQADFMPGQIVYGQGFAYANEVPDADRLVVRINLIEPGVNGRLLYCTQQVYSLWPAPPATPTPDALASPTSMPAPYVPPSTPTPDALASPTPTPAPYIPPPTPTSFMPSTPTPYLLPTSTPYAWPTPTPLP
ncbi:Tol-Pal system protein TolB [Thermoflexales bacterium]|nr:Tol-Pal system protein TolB [Thermoflexales bacterium]